MYVSTNEVGNDEERIDIEDKQAKQLASLPVSIRDRYLANFIIEHLGLFKNTEPDERGSVLLHQTYPQYVGNRVIVNLVELTPVDFENHVRPISTEAFKQRCGDKGSYIQKLMLKLMRDLDSLNVSYLLMEMKDCEHSFSIRCSNKHDDFIWYSSFVTPVTYQFVFRRIDSPANED